MARARHEPDALVIGIDASAAAMTQSSLRAARPERRGGLPNALFVVAAAECPPPELLGLADEVTILFPWGSLLRGTLALDEAAAAGVAAFLRPGGRVEAFLSITEHDALAVPPLQTADGEHLAKRWAGLGLDLLAFEPATSAEIDVTASTWARRLRAGRDRPVWRLSLGCGRRLAMDD